jgi:hypothetical protein
MIKIQLINDVTIQSTNLPGKTEKIKTWVDFIKSIAKSLKFGVAKLLTKLKMLLVFGWRKLSLVNVNGRQKKVEKTIEQLNSSGYGICLRNLKDENGKPCQ